MTSESKVMDKRKHLNTRRSRFAEWQLKSLPRASHAAIEIGR